MTEHELKLDNQKSIDLDSLIEKGKQGKLSSNDLEEVVEEMDFDIESLDKLYVFLALLVIHHRLALLAGIAATGLQALEASFTVRIDIPDLVTDLIVMIFQQQSRFDHDKRIGALCDSSADLVFYCRMGQGIQ